MNILYGINTNGQGHINRARTLIQTLEARGHKIDLLFGGPKPPKYVNEFKNKRLYIQGYVVKYQNHKVNYGKTLIDNFVDTINTFPGKIYKLSLLARLRKYDLIISDLEILTSLLGFKNKIPTISIDHQHSLIHPSAINAPGNYSDYVSALTAIYVTSPWKNHYFAIDFTDKMVTQGKGTLTPLFKKNDLVGIKTTNDDHFCVYLSYMSPQEIYNILKQFSDEKFYVFGSKLNKLKNNVQFLPPSRTNFLNYLTSAKGVISNSGFSLTWETVQLNKQILSIPVGNQYEQTVNAYRLNKLSLAKVSTDLTNESVKSFIDSLNNPCKRTKLPLLDPKVIIKNIEDKFHQLIS